MGRKAFVPLALPPSYANAIVMHLCIFLSLNYSFCFWLIDGCPIPTNTFPHCRKVKMFACIVRNITFMTWKNPGHWYPKSNFVVKQNRALYSPCNETILGKPRWMGSVTHRHLGIVTQGTIKTRIYYCYQCNSSKNYRMQKPCLTASLWQYEWQENENTPNTEEVLYYMQICLDPSTMNLVPHFFRVINFLIFRLSYKPRKHDA